MQPLVILTYLLTVLIWSTTPLAILWSQDSFTSLQALFWRMFVAWCCIFGYLLLRHNLPKLTAKYLLFIAISGGGLFIAMSLIYTAAPFIHSGLVAVIHGMLPLFTALFALSLLRLTLSKTQWLSLVICLLGMAVLFGSELSVKTTLWALFAVLAAVSVHALTAVLIKKLGAQVAVPHQLFGSLSVVSFACLLLLYLQPSPIIPVSLSTTSLYAVGFLALVGSLVGFICYYFLLKNVSPVTVGTITLLTPIFSMVVGQVLNQETFAVGTIAGTLILLIGLASYLRSSST